MDHAEVDRLLQSAYTASLPHGFAHAAGDVDSEGKPFRYRKCSLGTDGAKWQSAAHAEFVRLFEVRKNCHWIRRSQIPSGRIASYYNPRCKIKVKNGTSDYRVRGTYGGNVTDFTGDRTAHTADMTTVKILLNHTVSSPDWKWMTADITDMYLHTELDKPEYMFIDKMDIPAESWHHFNLDKLVTPGDTRVAVKITGGLYGLPQAGNLAQKKLITHLAAHGYTQCPHTTCLFKHETLPIFFSLIVDDFGISYKGQEAADHLLHTLRLAYPITMDPDGKKYAGFSINFDYAARQVRVSMPGYVQHALKQFNVTATSNTYAPELYVPVKYGSKASQQATTDSSDPLTPAEVKTLQEFVGTFLFYARGVDGTMLGPINRIASRQSKPTRAVQAAMHHFLQYAATWPNATLVYTASDMILRVDGDASYNSEPEARSRAAGYFTLGANNHPIECLSSISPTVVSAASEAEYATTFLVGQTAYGMRTTLAELGHPQPPTVITTDNKTAHGIATDTVKIKRSKAIDMRYHWIRDRVRLKDFQVTWRRGKDSVADFLTKAHPSLHCLRMRHHFVQRDEPTYPTAHSKRQLVRQLRA
jgi:hypothetical protein